MAEEFSDVRRSITAFLSALRYNIDRPLRDRMRSSKEDRERFMRTMMMVEEARIRFNADTYHEEPTRDEWNAIREDLLAFVNAFTHTDFVDPTIYDRPFRSGPMMVRDNSSALIRSLTDRENRPSVSEAIIIFKNFIERTIDLVEKTEGPLTLADLDRIVPRQQVAPVQFDIADGRIVIASRLPKTYEADRSNIQSALEHIRASGEQLLTNLNNSNCDKRLFESVSELHSQIISESNVVKVGLTNMACGVMGTQFQAELPDAIVGMLNAYNASISLYVAQFPEWEKFTQKASLIQLDEDDVAEIDIAAGEIIEALTENPELSDPEVPKTIAFVRQFLAFPGTSSKRAAFAMIRTIENLVSSIVRHGLNFFSKTADNVVDAGSKAASKVIVGLLGVALISASGIGPAAMRAGAPWVKQAAEVVQKQIEKAAE